MKISLPIRTYSEANIKSHWAVKAKRVKAQREAVALGFYIASREMLEQDRGYVNYLVRHSGVTVTLTRLAPRELDDDNLARSFKAVRDEVAKQLGIDDRDKRVKWAYAQRRGKVKEYGIELQIDAMASLPDPQAVPSSASAGGGE